MVWVVAPFTNNGTPQLGLAPTIDIWNASTGLQEVTAAPMVQVGDGAYAYDFTGYVSGTDYGYICDGGALLPQSDRYVAAAEGPRMTLRDPRVMLFFTQNGSPALNLSPTIRIRNVATGAQLVTDAAMTELGGGWYYYLLGALADPAIDFSIRGDGGAALPAVDRYTFASIGGLDVTLARATSQSVTTMYDIIRDELDDPAAFATGQTIPESQRRFTDARILRALQHQLNFMGSTLDLTHPHRSLRYADLTTTGVDDEALPTVMDASTPILKVEDMNDPTAPIGVDYVSPVEIEQYRYQYGATKFRWTLVGEDPSGTDGHPTARFVARPVPATGRVFRLWYVAPPVIPNAGADEHEFTVRWPELIALRCAREMLSRDDDFSMQQMERLAELMRLFRRIGHMRQTPVRVRRTRRGVSK